MNREEFLKQAKPVLFNTEMVKAILEGRKTVTRRVVKRDISNQFDCEADGTVIAYIDQATGDSYKPWEVCRFKKGDYLYVRETWCKGSIVCGEESDGRDVLYVSQCEGEDDYIIKAHALHEKTGIEDVVWKPSIHMPKEATECQAVKNYKAYLEEQYSAHGVKIREEI